jgi:uncharacterized membrane protein YdbT with pleckstrin-like domain
VQRKKAEKARAEFERGNDAHKIQEAMQRDAQEVQAQPLAEGVARIAEETRKVIISTLQARKPLSSFLLVALKCAGIELKNPQKYNEEDAFTVLAALGA